MNLGKTLFSDDGYNGGGMGQLWLGSSANLGASGTSVFGNTEISQISLAPDGSLGVMTNGSSKLYFFRGANTGTISVSGALLDFSSYGHGTDGDSVVLLPNADTALVAADSNGMLEIAGLRNFAGSNGFAPVSETSIQTGENISGLALSFDFRTLLARGQAVHVYAVSANPPYTVTGVGTISPPVVPFPDPNDPDGRGGLAISPQDSTIGVVVGLTAQNGGTPEISLITRLSSNANVVGTVPISGANHAYGVAISQDGTTAFVGTDLGIAVFTGVNTGSLAQVGVSPIEPMAGNTVLGQITTLAVTPDNSNPVLLVMGLPAFSNCGSGGGSGIGGPPSCGGFLDQLPIFGAGSLGPAATWQGSVPIPSSDQLIAH